MCLQSSDKQAVLAFLLKLSELIEAEQEASHSDSSLDFRNKVHTTQKRLMKDLPHNWLSRNSPAINYPSTAPLSFSSSNVQPIASSTVIAGKQRYLYSLTQFLVLRHQNFNNQKLGSFYSYIDSPEFIVSNKLSNSTRTFQDKY